MLLTITTTGPSAADLSYLLHKHPGRMQTFELSFGQVHVFYPHVAADRCTAALLLDVDPVGLVRGRRGPAGEGGALDQYVNDRPYVASSLLSVAIAQVLGSALGGRCKDRPEQVDVPMPLEARIAVLPCRGGEDFLRRLFEPLGYTLEAVPHPLDETFPEWGMSPYLTVTLRGHCRLHELLSHLYVLIPVLDNEKHYWVGDDEVEKLLRHGEGWLVGHPERDLIASRYLKYRRSLTAKAIERLTQEETPDLATAEQTAREEEAAVEAPLSLNAQRLGTVLAVLRESGARRVLDLGCGEGRLLQMLLDDRLPGLGTARFEQIVGMDVSSRSLEIAADRLRLDRLPPRQRERIQLLHGSLLYRDQRLEGFDAACAIEVIEHLDPPRLAAFERVVFEFARPGTVVITTPNREYNVKWETLPAGHMRHRDHRFEWTRTEFQRWATTVSERFGYRVRFLPVGPEDAEVGSPTQMGVFSHGR